MNPRLTSLCLIWVHRKVNWTRINGSGAQVGQNVVQISKVKVEEIDGTSLFRAILVVQATA